MSLDIDYYELLECDRSADDATLKASYRKLAMKYHPDKNPGCKDSEARFKAISEAYDCLRDPQKRAAYDRFGKAGVNGGGGFGGAGGADFGDIGDIFESIFGSAFGGARQQRGPARGADLRYDMEIRLEDAFAGVTREIAFRERSVDGVWPASTVQVRSVNKMISTLSFQSLIIPLARLTLASTAGAGWRGGCACIRLDSQACRVHTLVRRQPAVHPLAASTTRAPVGAIRTVESRPNLRPSLRTQQPTLPVLRCTR